MRKTKQILFIILIFSTLITPFFSYAAGLVPCAGSDCNFNALMTLFNKVIRFILFDIVVPIAAIMFAYAGFLLVTSGGSSEARTKANTIFTNTVWGLVIAVAAWLIIRTILSTLGYDGAWIGF